MEAPRSGTYLPAGYAPQYPPAAVQGKAVIEEEKYYRSLDVPKRERERLSDHAFTFINFFS